jgi:bile acid-coenzyme A ligase
MPSQEIISVGAALAREAQRQPHRVAVSCGEESCTWSELHRRTNRIARALAARGVKHGDFLTIALPNGIGFIEACYGAWKVGAVPQPVSSRLPAAESRAIAALAETPLVIGALPDAGRPTATPDELLAEQQDESALPDCIAPAYKAPTSGGSTGRPKLIVAGAPGVVSDIAHKVWKITPGEVLLMPGPLYHNAPFGAVFTALHMGVPAVIMPKFDPEATLREIERHRATWVYLVPTMMGRIWRLPEQTRAAYDVSSIRTLWHLAAPCPPWLKEAFINWFGPDAIMEMYGGTEAQAITLITGREWLEHRGSVGKPVGGYMKAFSPDGKELPPGETGEIYLKRLEGVAPTYRYIGAEARTLGGGEWESLGDIGWFDAEGYLYLADRRDDMILVGGANVYPAEIEAALDEHPLVQSSAVIGFPDEDLGNRIHAIVQPRAGLTVEALSLHLAERLVIYKRPRTFEFVSEPLRDDAGKVRRSKLREERLASAKSGS